MVDFADELLKIAADQKGPKIAAEQNQRCPSAIRVGRILVPKRCKLVSRRGAYGLASGEAAAAQKTEGRGP
ncbi:hypothetical protein A2U01_0068128, partial [Trifolium medium]|nr:hypothetical protein [Trifolium medium]